MGWVTCFLPDWGQCRQRGLIGTFCFPSGKLGCSPQRLHSGAPASNTVGKFSQRDIGCYRTAGRRCLRSPKCPAESPQTQTPLCSDLCLWYWEGGTESWRRHSEGAEYCLKDLRGCRLEENLICSTWLGFIFWPNIRKNLKKYLFLFLMFWIVNALFEKVLKGMQWKSCSYPCYLSAYFSAYSPPPLQIVILMVVEV